LMCILSILNVGLNLDITTEEVLLENQITPRYSWNITNVGVKHQSINQCKIKCYIIGHGRYFGGFHIGTVSNKFVFFFYPVASLHPVLTVALKIFKDFQFFKQTEPMAAILNFEQGYRHNSGRWPPK